jgi:hypothetical protein
MQLGRAIISQHLLASAENHLTPDKVELLSKATLEACDADGLKEVSSASPEVHQARDVCAGADGPNCLTAGWSTP